MSTLMLEDPEATARLARRIAVTLRKGDTIALIGDLGAGKSHFARAVISYLLAETGRHEDIPSPSFTLVQTYEAGGVEIWHADLYRLGNSAEVVELGLDEAFNSAICLVEWPDRLGSDLPARRLDVMLNFVPGRDEARTCRLIPRGPDWDRIGQAGLTT